MPLPSLKPPTRITYRVGSEHANLAVYKSERGKLAQNLPKIIGFHGMEIALYTYDIATKAYNYLTSSLYSTPLQK